MNAMNLIDGNDGDDLNHFRRCRNKQPYNDVDVSKMSDLNDLPFFFSK